MTLLHSRDKISWLFGILSWVTILSIYLPLTFISLTKQTASVDFSLEAPVAFEQAISAVGFVNNYTDTLDASFQSAASNFFDNVAKGDEANAVITNLVYDVGGAAPQIIHGNPAALFGPILQSQTFAILTANKSDTAQVELITTDIKNAIKNALQITNSQAYLHSIVIVLLTTELTPIITMKTGHELFQLLEPEGTVDKTSIAYQTREFQIMAAIGRTNFKALNIPIDATTFGGYLSQVFLSNVVEEDRYYKNKYIVPVICITVAIVVIYTALIALFWNEPEIRSKYQPFLIHMLISCFVCTLFMLLTTLNFARGHFKEAGLFLVIFFLYSLFSSINCRHRLMYTIFVKHRKITPASNSRLMSFYRRVSSSYFFPFFYHIPIMVATSTIVYCYTARTESIFQTFDQIYQIALVLFVVSFLFFSESLFYIFKTRNSWHKYVDFFLNIRIFLLFVSLNLLVSIYLFIEPYAIEYLAFQTISAFYVSATIAIYLLDAFTLIFLKIVFRKYGVKLFGNVEFLAQNGVHRDEISKIVSDATLCAKLLEFTKDRHCEENVLFLVDFSKWEKKVKNDRKRAITKADLIPFFEKYFDKASVHELNLTNPVKRRAIGLFDNLEDDELVNQDLLVLLFDRARQEVKKMLHDNVLHKFKQNNDVDQSYLRNLGLESTGDASYVSGTGKSRMASSRSTNFRSNAEKSARPDDKEIGEDTVCVKFGNNKS